MKSSEVGSISEFHNRCIKASTNFFFQGIVASILTVDLPISSVSWPVSLATFMSFQHWPWTWIRSLLLLYCLLNISIKLFKYLKENSLSRGYLFRLSLFLIGDAIWPHLTHSWEQKYILPSLKWDNQEYFGMWNADDENGLNGEDLTMSHWSQDEFWVSTWLTVTKVSKLRCK